ncbi:HIT family protein [Actinospongicola halichondriae]|uniref:HIT family protein n=1 Tax=Actinospongicola halichondriae TaxID=3236844 RepID=UPI003D4A2111
MSPADRTGLDRLWAGWRTAYIDEVTKDGNSGLAADDGSVFVRILRAIDAGELTDESAYVLHRGTHAFAILNAYPYGSGHLLVMPYREVGDLESLTPDESTDLWRIVNEAVVAVKKAYRPEGVNVGFNLGRAAGAGVPTHVHGHVLPRWDADSNFMTAVAEARVLPEPLPTTWRKLTDVWPSQGG